MAFPRVSDGRVDQKLTNVLLAYTSEDFIESMAFPTVAGLKDDTGKIPQWGNDHLRIYSTQKSIDDLSPNKIEWTMGSDLTYAIEYYEAEMDMIDRIADQFHVTNFKNATAFMLDSTAARAREFALATVLNDPTVLTNTSTPATLWDVNTSDPFSDIETAIQARKAATGSRMNYAITNDVVISKLQNHPLYRDRVSGIQKNLTRQDVVELIKSDHGFDEVLVGSAIRTTSKEGKTVTRGDVWADDFIMYTRPKGPSLFAPSFAYRLEIAGGNKRVDVRRHPSDKADIMRLMYGYQDKICDVDSAYLLDQVIS